MGAIVLYDGDVGIEEGQISGRVMRFVKRPSPYPSWVIDKLGIDFVHNATKVRVQSSRSLPEADCRRFWHAIAQLPALTHLEASGGVAQPGCIGVLAGHQRLESLKLNWAQINADDYTVIHKLGRLKELNLSETPVSDHCLAEIARSKTLECLDLHHTKITDNGLYQLALLPRLKRLWMSGTTIGDRGIIHLRDHPTLIDLDLCNTKITDQSLKYIASIQNLTELDLSLTDISDEGLKQFHGHPRLAYLNLSSSEVRGPGLAALEHLPALRELCIGGAQFDDDLTPLQGCSRLKCLSVSGLGILNRRTPTIPTTRLPPNLEELYLPLSRITDETLMSLANVRQLRRIRYSDDWSGPVSATKFRQLRPDCALEIDFFHIGQRHGLRSRP